MELKKIRIEEHVIELANEAAIQFSQMGEEGDRYFLRRFAFRRVLGYQSPPVLLVTVMDYGRPPRQRLITIVTEEPYSFLFPSIVSKDFFEVADFLGLNSDDEYAVLYGLVRVEYGIALKKCYPKRLRNVYDGKTLELPEELLSNIVDNEEESTWWQKWGGRLYRLRHNRDIPVIECHNIAWGVGSWKKVPFWITR